MKRSRRTKTKDRDDLFLGLGIGALIGYLVARSMNKTPSTGGQATGGSFNLPSGGQVASGGNSLIAPTTGTGNDRGYILRQYPYTGGCGSGTISTVHKVV